jgi:hypothetical protein
MPGIHGQLTSSELTRAIDAAETLLNLEPYLERTVYIKLSTLRADLEAEQTDRARLAGR